VKVFITGARGFIGSSLIKSINGIYFKKFSFTKDSIKDINLENFDSVIHLSSIVHSSKDLSWNKYQEININNTLNLAKKAKKAGVKQFVFMSTIKVYGEGSAIALTETSKCMPEDNYAMSKFIAEEELLKLKSNSFRVVIIRSPLVYGKNPKGNILKVIKLINITRWLPFGGIKNKRSMVSIHNLSKMIEIILKKEIEGIFLANDDKPVSTSEFISLVGESINKKVYLFKFAPIKILLKYFRPKIYKRIYTDFFIDNSYSKSRLGIKTQLSMESYLRNLNQCI